MGSLGDPTSNWPAKSFLTLAIPFSTSNPNFFKAFFTAKLNEFKIDVLDALIVVLDALVSDALFISVLRKPSVSSEPRENPRLIKTLIFPIPSPLYDSKAVPITLPGLLAFMATPGVEEAAVKGSPI